MSADDSMNVVAATSSERPLVSIVCLTFNHEAYIAQAIEGFVAQRATFPYEIIIHDDASTDETPRIIEAYRRRHPELITVLSQRKNLYQTGAAVPALVFGYARGQYIAYCEGDDFWCDSTKLQRQADYLSAHPDTGVVFTSAQVLIERRNLLVVGYDRSHLSDLSREETRAALLLGNPYTACTAMFRAEAVVGYEEVARRLRARLEDLLMWLFIAGKYHIGYVPAVTSTYRVRIVSVSHFDSLTRLLRFQRSAHRISVFFNRRYGGLVSNAQLRGRYRRSILEFCLANFMLKESLHYAGSLAEYVRCALRVIARPIYLQIASVPAVRRMALRRAAK